ncbi:MAG: glutamine-hydrolyzing carbamoyl-phosphate synthase small subunit [bacterium]
MSLLNRTPAALLLEDGTLYEGHAFGHRGATAGEVVFNTAMTGYQEILTDPSYRAQIVTMTYPHIGNYGVNAADTESRAIHPAGFIVREPCPTASNHRAEGDLEAYLQAHHVVGIAGIDTRALVRRIRDKGAMRGAIISGPADRRALIDRLDREPSMIGRDLVAEVTCEAPYRWTDPLLRLAGEDHLRPRPPQPQRPYRVVAYDFGAKHNILRLLVDHGCDVTVVPARTPAADALAHDPDGIFLSNGPGDPAALDDIAGIVDDLIGKRPMLGICLGHQIAAHALGGSTFKLKFGHRGANQPVRDLATGKVEITSQNHGFAVDPARLRPGVEVSHQNLNDGTVEGLAYRAAELITVQHHPEASPGPHDADPVFARFAAMMEAHR